MSSLPVRNAVRAFIEANTTETMVDLTGHYEDLREMLKIESIPADAPWLGIDFSSDGEEPVSLAADNLQGLYREHGIILLHICAAAKIGVGSQLETRGEALLNIFRGQRIGGVVVVEKVSPLNTGPGATLQFESGYVSGTISVQYHFDRVPGV